MVVVVGSSKSLALSFSLPIASQYILLIPLPLTSMPSSSTITTTSKSKIKSSLPSSTYKILTATVVRVYLSNGRDWNYSGLEGGISFVKDNSKNTFSFKLIDLKVSQSSTWLILFLSFSNEDHVNGSLFFFTSPPLPQGTRGIIWEHELYNNFVLNQDRTFFHTFEGDVSCKWNGILSSFG